ncbi:inhibitor of growth protein 1-like isoform X1 [Biomphalaria glabrata]|uniref:Inhibitor of growth protein n=2 Tax=Biomphalaria glabrata TaxID=6526 RepID=A0A2C9JDG8_BIOGL|nr:inhibitor of growth protein 1-like isoform X1 [Biomphalaria glabrata]
MVNNAAVEAICSATYLSNYLDTMETLPDDIQRNISQMRELHIKNKAILEEIRNLRNTAMKETGSSKKACLALQRALIHCQEIGDEKIQLVQLITDLIENRSRQLDQDREHLAKRMLADPGSTKEPEPEEVVAPVVKKEIKVEPEKTEKNNSAVKRQRRTKNDINEEETKEDKDKIPKKKKKRKVAKKETNGEDSPMNVQIDPNEPTYCSCNNISYGEMIGCDNEKCVIEWYHFGCVGLRTKPKGKWYCPDCRGDKSNVKRPDK